MNVASWTLADWLITAVPVVILFIAVRVGSVQMREFRSRTHDRGILATVAALSLIPEEAESPTDRAAEESLNDAPKSQKVLKHA